MLVGVATVIVAAGIAAVAATGSPGEHTHVAAIPAPTTTIPAHVSVPAPVIVPGIGGRPRRPWRPPRSPSRPHLTTPRPVRAPTSRVSSAGGNDGGGTTFSYYTLTNLSKAPCLLAGYPDVTAAAAGHPAVHAARRGYPLDSEPGANVAPGPSGALTVITERCPEGSTNAQGGSPSVVYTLTVTLPGGRTKALPGSVDVLCGLATGRVGVRQPQPVEVPVPKAQLTATMHLPQTAHPGERVHFTTTLTNPTSTVITLSPCPGYIQSSAALRTKELYSLNCDTVTAIAAGDSVTYEMEVVIPADMPPGSLDLG